jgi:hypothetical protein
VELVRRSVHPRLYRGRSRDVRSTKREKPMSMRKGVLMERTRRRGGQASSVETVDEARERPP